MKNKWSKSWKSSKQPRKQRKYAMNAPLHLMHRLLGAHLSKELRGKYGIRSVTLRSGDKVKIMRGKFSGSTGTVDSVDLKTLKVYVTGAESIKKDGSKILKPIHPSNLMITDLNLNDKRRQMKLNKENKAKE
jgi:large subunit ribosomal protein L24